MAYASNPPAFSPDEGGAGAWGVDSIGRNWYVIHKKTLRAKCIGPIGNKRTNYFDRAIAEAQRRNLKEN